jgi:hypothetical protein
MIKIYKVYRALEMFEACAPGEGPYEKTYWIGDYNEALKVASNHVWPCSLIWKGRDVSKPADLIQEVEIYSTAVEVQKAEEKRHLSKAKSKLSPEELRVLERHIRGVDENEAA